MTSAAFSTPESVSLEREAEFDQKNVDFEHIWTEDNRLLSKNWVNKSQFKKVCLQFPDSYLAHSIKICDDLKEICLESKFFILADTSYGSCCVDEIAAAHVESDCIIHFGNACKSKVSRLPVLYIFPQLPFDCDNFIKHLNSPSSTLPLENEQLSIFLDIGYQYLLDEKYKETCDKIQEALSNSVKVTIEKYPDDNTTTKDCSENNDHNRNACIFIGKDGQSFFNLSMSVKAKKWFIYDPSKNELKNVNPLGTNFIRRRYYYIEKCKDAQRLGLIVATLTSDGYLDVVKRIQNMAKFHGIKTHIISVGRINPAKLANFMEIDCYVLIGCPFNNLYTSREFFKPIISVFEAEIALNPAWRDKFPEIYITNFKDILPNGKLYNEFNSNDIRDNDDGGDVSLLTGRVRNVELNGNTMNGSSNINLELIEKRNQQIMQLNGGFSYEDRSWRGLDPALENREPAKLEKGLSGIPTKYTHDF